MVRAVHLLDEIGERELDLVRPQALALAARREAEPRTEEEQDVRRLPDDLAPDELLGLARLSSQRAGRCEWCAKELPGAQVRVPTADGRLVADQPGRVGSGWCTGAVQRDRDDPALLRPIPLSSAWAWRRAASPSASPSIRATSSTRSSP